MRDTKIEIWICIIIIPVILIVIVGYNMLLNNRTVYNDAYFLVSYATGLSGHVEYTIYSDGSQDVKIYPSLGHRIWDSELHQDLNGDNLVDRIRRHGAEWKMNRLSELLVREIDYEKHKKRFDEADENLKKLANKYSKYK